MVERLNRDFAYKLEEPFNDATIKVILYLFLSFNLFSFLEAISHILNHLPVSTPSYCYSWNYYIFCALFLKASNKPLKISPFSLYFIPFFFIWEIFTFLVEVKFEHRGLRGILYIIYFKFLNLFIGYFIRQFEEQLILLTHN